MSKPGSPLTCAVRRVGRTIGRRARNDDTTYVGAVRDLLTDIRHYCDAKGLDFHERLKVSREVYLEEKGLELRGLPF